MNRFATLIALTAALIVSHVDDASAQYPQIQWRFGMNVSVTSNGVQKGLMVKSVAPGSPAHHAGLQPGMIILTANGRDFNQAQNDYHGVALLQQAVTAGGGGGGVPTVAYTTPSPRVHLHVVKPCGAHLHLDCYPQHVGGGGGGVPTI